MIKKIFPNKTIFQIGYQMMLRIEYVHSKDIYRDIKPSNFVIGKGQNKIINYLIDFG